MSFNFREKWFDCLLDDVFNNVIRRVIRPCFAPFCFVSYQFERILLAMKMMLHQSFVDGAELLHAQITEIDSFCRKHGFITGWLWIEHYSAEYLRQYRV